ncbi:MAG: hypothetical protein Kow00108_26760 [Calditrichia bacterium]
MSFFISISRAENSSGNSYYIEYLEFEGLNRTREAVLKRELSFTIPGQIDEKQIREYKERIKNLNLFKRVEYAIKQDTLVIMVDEVLSYMIVPSFHVIERDWSRITYGLMYIDFNLGGDKIFFSSYGWLGYNKGFSLSFLDDWFTSKKFIIGANVSIAKYLNRNTEFDEIHQLFTVQLGKRFLKDIYFFVNVGKHMVIPPDEEKSLYNLPDKFNYNVFNITLNIDKRNFMIFPSRGFYASVNYSTESKSLFSLDHKHVRLDFRQYLPVKGTVLAFRQYFHAASQHLPLHDGVYFGYNERIRGHFDLIINSRAIVEYMAEFRFPVIKKRFYNIPYPFERFAHYFNNLEFGVSGGLFIDNGLYSDYWKNLSTKSRFYGYGASLYFHLPYNNIMRLDFAFDEKRNYEIILENVVSF